VIKATLDAVVASGLKEEDIFATDVEEGSLVRGRLELDGG